MRSLLADQVVLGLQRHAARLAHLPPQPPRLRQRVSFGLIASKFWPLLAASKGERGAFGSDFIIFHGSKGEAFAPNSPKSFRESTCRVRTVA